MTNYIVHFEDGSEFLAHYGVQGMKWGVWNEETRRRRSGVYEKHKTTTLRSVNAKTKRLGKAVLTSVGILAFSTAVGVTALLGDPRVTNATITGYVLGGAASTAFNARRHAHKYSSEKNKKQNE